VPLSPVRARAAAASVFKRSKENLEMATQDLC